jgi:hypothetical protein
MEARPGFRVLGAPQERGTFLIGKEDRAVWLATLGSSGAGPRCVITG